MIEKIKHHQLLILLVLFGIGLFFLYFKIQPALTYSFSPLFDGNEYLKAYNYFNHQLNRYDVSFPFNSRILVPFLASLLPFTEPVSNFLALNLIFTILSVIGIYFLWKHLNIPPGHIMTGFFWLFIHWVGIIRHNIFDPITVDVPLYFFQILLLFIIFKRNYLWLLILGPLATIQKESFPALLAVLLLLSLFEIFYQKVSYKHSVIIGLSLVLSYTVKTIIDYYFPPVNPGNNSILVILFHMKETLLNPFRCIRWLVAIFTAYGPMMMLALWTSVKTRTLHKGNFNLLLLSITYLFLSLFAGGDMTRIAFLGFPFIMTWILIKLKDEQGFMFKAAFIAGIPLLKFFGTIPDPAVSGWDKFYNWFPEFANPVIILLWLVYGILCLAMFRIIDKKLSILH